MDSLGIKIMEEVKRHNVERIPIYRKVLIDLMNEFRIASRVTTFKRINDLVEDGSLIEIMVAPSSGRGIYKYLYVPGFERPPQVVFVSKEDGMSKIERMG